MPQEYKRSVHGRQQVTITSNPQDLAVVANPVDTFVHPGQNKYQELARALDGFQSAGFTKLAQQKHLTYVDDERTAGQKNRAEAVDSPEEINKKIAAGEMNREQSVWFQQGYMKLHGVLAGQEAKRSMFEAYNDPNQFNPDTDDLEVFMQKFAQQDGAGIEDTDFQKGYVNGLVTGQEELRNAHSKAVVARVQENTQQAFRQYIREAFLEAKQNGGNTLSVEQLDLLKKDGVEVFGMTNKQVEVMAFEAAEIIANDDNDEKIFDVFREKRGDGSPGFADTKLGSDAVNAAVSRAQAAQLRALRLREKLTKARNDAINDNLQREAMALVMAGDDIRPFLLKNINYLDPSDARALQTFANSYGKAEVLVDNELFGRLLGQVTSNTITSKQLNDYFMSSVQAKIGITSEQYQSLVRIQGSIQNAAGKNTQKINALNTSRDYLQSRYDIGNAAYYDPTEVNKVKRSKGNAEAWFNMRVSQYISDNSKRSDFDLNSQTAHTDLQKIADEAEKRFPPPKSFLDSYSQVEGLPAKYTGERGATVLARDYRNKQLTDGQYKQYLGLWKQSITNK